MEALFLRISFRKSALLAALLGRRTLFMTLHVLIDNTSIEFTHMGRRALFMALQYLFPKCSRYVQSYCSVPKMLQHIVCYNIYVVYMFPTRCIVLFPVCSQHVAGYIICSPYIVPFPICDNILHVILSICSQYVISHCSLYVPNMLHVTLYVPYHTVSDMFPTYHMSRYIFPIFSPYVPNTLHPARPNQSCMFPYR